MKIGIVGLPNVGKSTLFNALLRRQQALSANYPFATIEPNIGVVDVIDNRLDHLSSLSRSKSTVYANITFVDIAGIVKGASEGLGLGNRFLANIREVDLILVVLRDFEDENIIKEGSINPLSDFEVIMIELILKDLETINNQAMKIKKVNSSKEERLFEVVVAKIGETLNKSLPANKTLLNKEEAEIAKNFHLLTLKPILKIYNVSEQEIADRAAEYVGEYDMAVSAKIESDISVLNKEDQVVFLKELGLKESPLNNIIRRSYDIVGYKTFFTTGEKESRAWKYIEGSSALECAGIIHTDFIKSFVKAEIIKYDDFITYKSKLSCKENGRLRIEGKEYVVQEGDIIEFRLNK